MNQAERKIVDFEYAQQRYNRKRQEEKNVVEFRSPSQERRGENSAPREGRRTSPTVKVRGHVDYVLLALVLTVTAFGLVFLFSASFYNGQIRQGDGYYYLFRQFRGVALGLVAMAVLARIDYTFWKKHYKLIYFGSLGLLLLVFVPGMGATVNEGSRWIKIGSLPVFQPSEVSKFGLIVSMAAIIERKGKTMQSFWKGLVPVLLMMGILDIVIYLQPNFSIFSITAMTCFVMLIVSGAKAKHLVLLAIGALGVGVPLMMAEEYRRLRLISFTNPWSDQMLGSTYQLRQSLIGIGSGGLFGTGLGQSRQKLLFLPMNESDFIFSIIAEENGFFVCVLLIAVYMLIIWRGLRIAWKCQDPFGRLCATGITAIIGFQAIVNIAVATGSMPTTGVPLPFISYGSSSMLCFMAATGILLNISKKCSARELARMRE